MSANRFAALSDYDPQAEVPEREKVHREKDRHEPGAGYRGTMKRQGRGRDNWGNDIDDAKRPELVEPEDNESGEIPESTEPKRVFVPASSFFGSDSDDEEEPVHVAPKVESVPEAYAKHIARKRENVVVRPAEADDHQDIETGFLSTPEVMRRNESERQRGRGRGGRGGSRGGPRDGRGGSRGGPREGRGGSRGGPREGRGGRGGHAEGESRPPRQEEQGDRQGRPPRKGARDSHPMHNQGQRHQGTNNLRMNDHNFPRLGGR